MFIKRVYSPGQQQQQAGKGKEGDEDQEEEEEEEEDDEEDDDDTDSQVDEFVDDLVSRSRLIHILPNIYFFGRNDCVVNFHYFFCKFYVKRTI